MYPVCRAFFSGFPNLRPQSHIIAVFLTPDVDDDGDDVSRAVRVQRVSAWGDRQYPEAAVSTVRFEQWP